MNRNLILLGVVVCVMVISELTDTLAWTIVIALNLAILYGIWWAGRSAWRSLRG